MREEYGLVRREEMGGLEGEDCIGWEWSGVEVGDNFGRDYIYERGLCGKVGVGVFEKEFSVGGGMGKDCGVYYGSLENVRVGEKW